MQLAPPTTSVVVRHEVFTTEEDVALAGFDDFAWADLFSPSLTAVAQPSRDLGAAAVGLLLERLEDPERPARTLRLPCEFVHRTSCGCAADAAVGEAARTG